MVSKREGKDRVGIRDEAWTELAIATYCGNHHKESLHGVVSPFAGCL